VKTNTVWMALLSLALVFEAGMSMAAALKPVGHQVIVYVRQDNLLVADLGRAERTATGIFAVIGVPVVFRAGAEPKSTGEGAISIEVRLDAKTPAQFHAGALAYAMPFGASGTRIHVFCDRVRNARPDGGTGTILGYVMAHEVAHVLQGVTRHSAEGIMKARWETPDYSQMKSGSLPFDPTDAELIHAALEKSVTQSARAEPPPR
jgi:hypothetical protein